MKVQLIRENRGDFYAKSTKPTSASLPFYQTFASGYVHRVRSAHMHYDAKGKHTHTSVKFWCGQHRFLYPKNVEDKATGAMVESPDMGRVVCATCQARAHGSGQVGTGKLGSHFIKYRPRPEFFPKGRN